VAAASDYKRHYETKVRRHLQGIDGFRGAATAQRRRPGGHVHLHRADEDVRQAVNASGISCWTMTARNSGVLLRSGAGSRLARDSVPRLGCQPVQVQVGRILRVTQPEADHTLGGAARRRDGRDRAGNSDASGEKTVGLAHALVRAVDTDTRAFSFCSSAGTILRCRRVYSWTSFEVRRTPSVQRG
jgi:hypothetical protein